jgi:autotransporter-associated beta strand protein
MGIGALEGGPNTILAGPSATAGILVWAIGSSTNNPNTIYYGTIKNNAANEVTSVTKIGTGSLTLAGQNSYGGTTTVSSGTLAFINNPFTGNDGSINNSTNITIAAGAAIDVSGLSTGTLPLGSSQFLQGYGTIRGILDNTAGGNISPGGGISGGVGTLTVTNYINLGGTAWMKLNRTASPNCDRLVSSLAGINYGGTLIVTNIGGGLHAGDTFTLFSGAGFTNSFSTVTLPNYYTWNTSQLTVNGTISVSSVAPPTLAVDFSGLGGGSITFNAANGLAGGPLTILASTNVALPLSSWTTVTTGNFDGGGNFSTPVTVNPTVPQQYFILSAQ